MSEIVVVVHSAKGRTLRVAEAVVEGAVARGASAYVMPVEEVDWRALADADAIVFGCPTYMGSVSAAFKAFMDASSAKAWASRHWRDKIAAGFTCSSSLAGDKQNVLVQLATFAAQHGMVWLSLDALPGRRESDVNRFGSSLGAMACAPPGETSPPEGDLRTARHLGGRVARATARWHGRRLEAMGDGRHPTTQHWAFPPRDRAPLPAPLRRVSLRELAARPGRFEHHLMVVGGVGDAQLEIATASEPLYYAHANISDEYALAMSTGDGVVDGFPMLTLLSDPATHDDVGRYKHRVGDLVLHPFGYLHWPGRLRPPHEPFVFAEGTRRCGYSFVFCARKPLLPVERPLFCSREGATKSYHEHAPPFLLADTTREEPRRLAEIGTVGFELVVRPERVAPPQGGYLLVLEGEGAFFAGDLVYLPEGAAVDGTGIERAIVIAGDVPPDPPPRTWLETPAGPFACFEEAPAENLPVAVEGLRVEAVSASHVSVKVGDASADVPRYWMARMLFRIALHRYAIGYLETYGGFVWDDREGEAHVGLRGHTVVIPERDLAPTIERLYRAVAPEGYVERLA